MSMRTPGRASITCCIAGGLLLALPADAGAEQIPKANFVETGVKHFNLTEGQPDTAGAYLKAFLDPQGPDAWLGEVVYLDRFGDSGSFFALANTHTWNPDWYSHLAVGSSSGGFFWPRLRVDAALSRKWLAQRNFVTTLGFTYFDAKDEFSDKTVSVEGAYFFSGPWVLQAGVKINRSDPGSVHSSSGFSAVSYGRAGEQLLVLRAEVGNQGYQAIAEESVIVDFPFHTLSLTWRRWLGRDWGFNLRAESFHSSAYDQRGFELGVFRAF